MTSPANSDRTFSTSIDAALFLLRALCGVAFVFHGWGKIQDPFGWMGPDAFAPGVFQALAALSEFGGGIAWILGLLTRLAAFGIACTMVVAVYVHAVMMGDPFIATQAGVGSYEPAAKFLVIAILLMATGPGAWSLDAWWKRARASAKG